MKYINGDIFYTRIVNIYGTIKMIYKKPAEYIFIHVLCGYMSAFFPVIGVFFILYQLFQLVLNRRFFLFQMKIEKRNSIAHTSIKLAEFCIGLTIGIITKHALCGIKTI